VSETIDSAQLAATHFTAREDQLMGYIYISFVDGSCLIGNVAYAGTQYKRRRRVPHSI
jgi:hypothetical protein